MIPPQDDPSQQGNQQPGSQDPKAQIGPSPEQTHIRSRGPSQPISASQFSPGLRSNNPLNASQSEAKQQFQPRSTTPVRPKRTRESKHNLRQSVPEPREKQIRPIDLITGRNLDTFGRFIGRFLLIVFIIYLALIVYILMVFIKSIIELNSETLLGTALNFLGFFIAIAIVGVLILVIFLLFLESQRSSDQSNFSTDNTTIQQHTISSSVPVPANHTAQVPTDLVNQAPQLQLHQDQNPSPQQPATPKQADRPLSTLQPSIPPKRPVESPPVKTPTPIMKEAPARVESLPQRDPIDFPDLKDFPDRKLFPETADGHPAGGLFAFVWGSQPSSGKKNELRDGWRVIGASRIGLGHSIDGKYREDDFEVKLIGKGIVLVAIADGVSSKRLSRYGARAAVLGSTTLDVTTEARLQRLAELVRDLPNIQQDQEKYQGLQEECHLRSREILRWALQAASDSVRLRSQQDDVRQFVSESVRPHTSHDDVLQVVSEAVKHHVQHENVLIDQLQSTLMVFFAIPCNKRDLYVASVQVGDGALYSLQPDKGLEPRNKWDWLQQPQIQGAGNEVQPFMNTDPEMWPDFCKCELVRNVTFIMGMTDGTADDIEPPHPTREEPEPDPFVNVNDFYERIVKPAFKKPEPADALIESLGYRKRQSFDDRTVVCLYRQ